MLKGFDAMIAVGQADQATTSHWCMQKLNLLKIACEVYIYILLYVHECLIVAKRHRSNMLGMTEWLPDDDWPACVMAQPLCKINKGSKCAENVACMMTESRLCPPDDMMKGKLSVNCLQVWIHQWWSLAVVPLCNVYNYSTAVCLSACALIMCHWRQLMMLFTSHALAADDAVDQSLGFGRICRIQQTLNSCQSYSSDVCHRSSEEHLWTRPSTSKHTWFMLPTSHKHRMCDHAALLLMNHLSWGLTCCACCATFATYLELSGKEWSRHVSVQLCSIYNLIVQWSDQEVSQSTEWVINQPLE